MNSRSSLTSRLLESAGVADVVRPIQTSSMNPTLIRGDSIRFKRDARVRPHPGDLWVYLRADRHIAHRIVWASSLGEVLTKGDANHHFDGWIPRKQLFGPVTAIRRGDRWYPTNRRRDRILGLTYSLTRTGAYLAARSVYRLGKRLAGRTLRLTAR